jgi:SAM-dependent methyltransferase
MPDVAELKTTHRATWAAGDYGAVAERIDEVPPAHLLSKVDIQPGQDVLDVATGTGNVALRAAALGATVTGLDLTPELFDRARERQAEFGVGVDWVEGDAEDLPFADDSFDRVLSTFGTQFAPRHVVTAHELVRVTRAGGLIGLANWTPEGQVGELFRIMGRYMPALPEYASPPPLWGDEAHVRELFAGTDVELRFERGLNPWHFGAPEDYVAFMETWYGPTVKARERLTAEGTWDACRAEILAMTERRNRATDGRLLFDSEYLLVVGRKVA